MRKLLFTVCALVLVTTGSARTGTERSQSEPGHRLVGLHIGIGEYSDQRTARLTLHRTVNNRVVPLLTERFVFDSFETVLDVDREAFRDALLDLYRRALEASASDDDVTVVFMYTGHGSRVPDDDGDEPDGKDETFVTVHSSLSEGRHDVRDDDINAFRHALAAHGIHLTMIVEACHSATSFRGPNIAGFGARGAGVTGPDRRLFEGTELSGFYESEAGQDRGWFEGDASERFVILAAARDRQMARAFNFKGEQWGLMTLALYRAISSAPEGATYAEIFGAVLRHVGYLSRDHAISPSTPMLHVADGRTADTAFLGQTLAANHVRASLEADRVTIDAGFAAGFETGAVVGIFPSVEAIRAGEDPLATTTVTHADFAAATLDAETMADEVRPALFDGTGRAYAVLLAGPLSEASVYLDAGLSPALRTSLRVEEASGRISIAEKLDDATYVIEPSPTDPRRIELRWASRPIMEHETPPIAVFSAEESSGIWDPAEITNELNRLVRIRRVMDLASPTQDLHVELAPIDADLRDAWSGGDRRLPHGGSLSMTIRNDADEPRYLYLIAIGITNNGHLTSDVPVRDRYLRADEEAIARISATLPDGVTSERITYVLISCVSPLHNLPRLIADSTERTGSRGQDPLYDLLDDAVATRSPPTSDLPWSAATVEFEIVAARSTQP